MHGALLVAGLLRVRLQPRYASIGAFLFYRLYEVECVSGKITSLAIYSTKSYSLNQELVTLYRLHSIRWDLEVAGMKAHHSKLSDVVIIPKRREFKLVNGVPA